MDDLIAALTILRKYGNPAYPTHCEHDELRVNIDADIMELSRLGFEPDDDGGFYSFRFGSA